MNCRFCNNKLVYIIADLGMSPLANSYLTKESLFKSESFFPLRVSVCHNCFLVQLSDTVETPEKIFSEYLYFSSYSETWLSHIKQLTDDLLEKFPCDQNSKIIEIASNDGYLLKHFKNKNIPILGIEPASNISKIANDQGIKTIPEFFGTSIAKKLKTDGQQSDILIAINVMPHVPDVKDFANGLKILLKPNGILVIQFSTYLLPFLEYVEFDSIYHEHYSYFSLYSIIEILSTFDLEVFDVNELSIHGGSLRLYVKHKNNVNLEINQKVNELLKKEIDFGISEISTYTQFSQNIKNTKIRIWELFSSITKERKTIVGYGAPAKGNTLLNYCGIGKDLLDYTVDISPHKQHLFLPGTHIPILEPEEIRKTKPDYVLILAWNLKDEIMKQMSFIRDWGGKFVILIPKIEVI